MNDVSPNFDTNIALVESNGKVNWISVELGAIVSGSNYSTFLEDEASESNLSSIYLGDGSRKLDLGYSVIHKGARSISNIETRGVLMDSARKVFRGNLDFKRGAKRASGIEEEYVILLDPTVKSDSIPALLCDEDDVQGEHAASAGQIDKNKLFYLMSRGLSERESKKLIIEATFRPIIDKIPLEELQDIINSEISRRLTDA
jgi:Fe-S cluster assembly scaffold protein SufB